MIEHTKVSSLINTHTSEPAMVKYNSNLKIAQYAPAFSHLPRAGVTVNKYQINALGFTHLQKMESAQIPI